jgi:MoaA/NifB/PqqE/SkfB family radical SAM enzyme
MTLIQITQRPPDPPGPSTNSGPIAFAEAGHHFKLTTQADLDALVEQASVPLSVILQVTRRCNFDCDFCSETLQIPDPTLDELDDIRQSLAGVQRVFLSGGEPLLRPDFIDVVDMYGEFIIGVPTNATRGTKLARDLAGKVAFVNVGLEGPRSTTNRVRGDYDKVLAGTYEFMRHDLPLSFSAVVLRSTLHALPYTCQIADALGAGKLKLIHPIRKGNGLMLSEDEFITLEESAQLFQRLTELKAIHDWSPAIRMTTWTPETEGYSILVYPDGQTWAWPVYTAEDKVGYLGNLHQEPISELWKRYPFKSNHFRKYLGKSIHVTT